MAQKYIKKYCPVCNEEFKFVSTESPKGYWVCTECQFRTSFGRVKVIKTLFGWIFVEENKN